MMKRQRPAIHPGEFLLEELETRNMTVNDLASASGISPDPLSAIVAGAAPVTVDVARRLAAWIGSSPDDWRNLQRSYDLRSRQSFTLSF